MEKKPRKYSGDDPAGDLKAPYKINDTYPKTTMSCVALIAMSPMYLPMNGY